mmetsp:Transcript_110935/g.214839  ORF Transcript_110935/g.214839 Transcript_110935/m.214839 type:complete len:495 (-) Transcript_110935:281-1765(-)
MGHITRANVAAASLACMATAWSVDSGYCVSFPDGCVASSNYPDYYLDSDSCIMSGSVGCAMRIVDFATESGYDRLVVNGNVYSGTEGPEGVIPDHKFTWHTDFSDTSKGWKICPDCSASFVQQVNDERDMLSRQIDNLRTHQGRYEQNLQERLSGQIDDLRINLGRSEQNLQDQISDQQAASLAKLSATEEGLTNRVDGSEHSLREQISRLKVAVDSGNVVARNAARETASLPRDIQRNMTQQIHVLAGQQAALANHVRHDLRDMVINATQQSLADSMEVRHNVNETFMALEQKELKNRAVATAGLKSTERAVTARMRDEVGILAYQNSKDAAHLRHDVEALAHQEQAAAPLQNSWFQGFVLCTCAAALALAVSSYLQGAHHGHATIQMPLLSQSSSAPASGMEDGAVHVDESAVSYRNGQQQQQYEARLLRLEHEVSRLATPTSSQDAPSNVRIVPGVPMTFTLEDSSAVESVASVDEAASSQGWFVSGEQQC